MAFTFNWAGLQVPQMQRKDNMPAAVEAAGEFGRAVKGYEKKKADAEYKDMLSAPTENPQAIMLEIQRLEQRNAEIRKLLGV